MSRFPVTVKVSDAHATSGTSVDFDPFPATGNDEFHAAVFALSVTAVAGTLPTLDTWIQMQMPDGSWTYFVSFQRVTTVGTRIATIIPLGPPETAEGGIVTKALSTGSVRTFPLAAKMRVIWTIGGTAGQSFTFAVKAELYASPVPELGH